MLTHIQTLLIREKKLNMTKFKKNSSYLEEEDTQNLIEYMTSAPVLVQVLEGESAIAKNRELMGATNPQDAAPGTIRADFAESIDANAVHGSDSESSALREINYFFEPEEIVS